MINIIRQYDHPDCSLDSFMNCAKLNNPELDRIFTQDLADRYMPEYLNKHPKDAYRFFKDRGYDVKIMPFDLRGAKVRLKKGSALCAFIWLTFEWWSELVGDRIQTWRPSTTINKKKPHWFVIQEEKGKTYIYDSNLPWRYEIEDWDRFVREGAMGKTFYQVR